MSDVGKRVDWGNKMCCGLDTVESAARNHVFRDSRHSL